MRLRFDSCASRFTLAAALTAATAIFATPSLAHATAKEPNGLTIPLDSMNGETQLYTFFSSQGESIDWIADGKTTPSSFSPRCGFGATFLLNQAGSRFGLAWYNDLGTTPAAGDLHTIVPANSPLGTKFAGADIIKDPAYKGGKIGFALVGGQTHFTDPAYDPVCTACTPAAPWITAVVYQSKKAANTYYLAFEDGDVSASGWNNDGDFNDDVYSITGVACSGSGAPCDTGKKGICAKGTTSCVNGALVCVQVAAAGTKQCNGLDNDCDGAIDDGPCNANEVCTQGRCIPKCDSGEFQCAAGLTCDANGLCVEPACIGKTCPAGQTCVGGACVDACTGVTCPFGNACQNGVCVDPCAGVACSADEVCEAGACKLKCDCAGCPSGATCASNGRCVTTACATASCGAGTHCDAATGGCVDDCTGAVCPKGQQCTAGACVAVPNAGDAGADGGDAGNPFDDGGLGPFDDAGSGADGGDASAVGFAPPAASSSSGCGCAVPGQDGSRDHAALGLALGALALVAARRSRAVRRR
jgi:MYXO-CTERM domain-containing protein